jgi:hypothetical protein
MAHRRACRIGVEIMMKVASRNLARGLIGLAALGLGGTASANDSVAGAILGAGAGAIIGHTVGGPDAAVAGGLIGAMTGAAVASSHFRPGVSVHSAGGYGYPPPAYYPRPSRGPVYVVPPPAIVVVPGRAHGYWHHGYDAWGHPLRTWVPAPPPRRYYAPPRPHHHGHGHGHHHRPRW